MSFMLRNAEAASQLDPLTRLPSDFGETFSAGVAAARIEMDSFNRRNVDRQQAIAEISDRLGSAYGDGPSFTLGSFDRIVDAQVAYATDRVAALRQNDADGRYDDLPTTPEEFENRVTALRQAEYEAQQDILDNGSAAAGILGNLWAGVTDESTLASLPFGVAAGTRIGVAAGVEAGVSVATEAATLPRQFAVADELDLPMGAGEVALSLGTAGILGGALGGGVAAAQRYFDIRRTRQSTTGTRRPPEADQVTFGDAVDTSEEAMNEGREVDIDPIYPPGQVIPEKIRNGIFAGESGGDYDALFSFQNRPGGRFADVKLTEMTVDEAIAFSAPRGRYGQWVKSRIGRVATPMGAYQIVGTTLRAAKKGLGLRGDEIMTEALQDRLGWWIWREQGTGAWEGYRGPRDTAVRPSDGPAPDAGSADYIAYGDRRGYTQRDQVTAGDDLRIDVDYEVVDARSLIRASGDLQPRDRSRRSSDEQVAEMAARLDPARLMPSPEADRGAPIVGPDNVIESGNGRVMAIQRAFERNPNRADAYRQQIEAAGFTIPEGVDQPVLIARRSSELSPEARQQFVRAANSSAVARMSATERAAADARAIDADTVALFDPARSLAASENAPFVRRALDSLPQSERSGLVDATGALNDEGQRRIRQALFARAFDAPDILSRYAETGAGELLSLMEALEQAAPGWAALRGAVGDGRLRQEFDITAHVTDAMRIIAEARIVAKAGGRPADILAEMLADEDLFEGAVAPLTAALARRFYKGGRAARADQVAELLTRYAAEARRIGTTDAALFSETPGPLDALKAIDSEAFGDLDTIGAAPAERPQPIAAAADPADDTFPDGAMSDEAAAADAALEQEFNRPLSRQTTDPVTELRQMKDDQPADSLDDLYLLAPGAKTQLDELGDRIAADAGATFTAAALKDMDTAAAKIERKRYSSVRELTDIVRGGFLVNTAEQADQVVQGLKGGGRILDEGWTLTPEGYADRKVLLQTESGLIAEIQIWSPELLKAKKATGHKLYTRARSSSDPDEIEELTQQMRALYAEALRREDPSIAKLFGTSNDPNAPANLSTSAASDGSTDAVWDTSSASTASQLPPGSRSASASPRATENSTAGRPSQLTNVRSDMGDTSTPDIGDDAAPGNTDGFDLADDFGDLEITLDDGSRMSVREALDDLEADDALQRAIDGCPIEGTADG